MGKRPLCDSKGCNDKAVGFVIEITGNVFDGPALCEKHRCQDRRTFGEFIEVFDDDPGYEEAREKIGGTTCPDETVKDEMNETARDLRGLDVSSSAT